MESMLSVSYSYRDELFRKYCNLYKAYYGDEPSDLDIRRMVSNNITDNQLEIRIKALELLLEIRFS